MVIKERDFIDLPKDLRPQEFPKDTIYCSGVLDDGRRYSLVQVPHGSESCLVPVNCPGVIWVPLIQGQKGILKTRACGVCERKPIVAIDLLVLKMELGLPLT